LNPRHASTRQWYSRLLAEQSRLEESLREIRTARDLDPVSPIIAHAHGLTLRELGRIDEAIAEFRRALELQPSFPVSYEQLSGIYLERGVCNEAISAQEKSVATGSGELRRRATLVKPWRGADTGAKRCGSSRRCSRPPEVSTCLPHI